MAGTSNDISEGCLVRTLFKHWA